MTCIRRANICQLVASNMAASGLLFPKLVVFGASGPTGRLVIQHALQKGHFITAVVRSPEKFDVR